MDAKTDGWTFDAEWNIQIVSKYLPQNTNYKGGKNTSTIRKGDQSECHH